MNFFKKRKKQKLQRKINKILTIVGIVLLLVIAFTFGSFEYKKYVSNKQNEELKNAAIKYFNENMSFLKGDYYTNVTLDTIRTASNIDEYDIKHLKKCDSLSYVNLKISKEKATVSEIKINCN